MLLPATYAIEEILDYNFHPLQEKIQVLQLHVNSKITENEFSKFSVDCCLLNCMYKENGTIRMMSATGK